MNPEIKERWVTALRSGKYAQARRYLNVGNRYCCLGVLCELAVEDGIATKGSSESFDRDLYMYGDRDGNIAESLLSPAIARWAGLESHAGAYTTAWTEDLAPFSPNDDGNAQPTLTFLNDDLQYDFNQIADVIEANF